MREGSFDDLAHAPGISADHEFKEQVDAKRREVTGDDGGVGVDDLAKKQFGANGNDFGVGHGTFLLR